MTIQGKNKNRNHINTGVSFDFIHYMANILGWGEKKWQDKLLLNHFLNEIPFIQKQSCFCLKFYINKVFIFYTNLTTFRIVLLHASKPGVDDNKLRENAECK